MRIGLVRHGQTQWNLSGRLQGSSDTHLNATGRVDAALCADTLARGGWKAVVSSPLWRAAETADIIARRLGILRLGSYPLLVERSFGEAEGLTLIEAARRWPTAEILQTATEAAGIRFPELGVPGVEPIEAVRKRGLAALEQIALDVAPSPTVVVCHGTLIRVVLSTLAGFEVPRILNGALHEIEFSAGQWVVVQ